MMFMFQKNRNLFVIAVVAFVNALGYGIIIPIMYTYSQKFGLSDFDSGLLFALFSLCSFLSTPLLGRLSDKYGRKPLLMISISGTAISFLMAAFAPSAIFLFLARALDGITAGNIPVASAVISDTTEPKDRAKGFGIIGASFGFGFVFGPAISALTLRFGDAVPFLIAAGISVLAVIITGLMLPETNKHLGEVAKGKIFDFVKLATALTDQKVGQTLLISLFNSLAFGMFIFAFQPFSVKVIGLEAQEISIIFTVFGVVGLITQALLVSRVTKKLGDKRAFSFFLLMTALAFVGFVLAREIYSLVVVSVLLALSNSFNGPLIQTILSKETDDKSQGSIQGLNASYVSLGTVFGPIIAGGIAVVAIPLPFVAAGVVMMGSFVLSFNVLKKGVGKESAF